MIKDVKKKIKNLFKDVGKKIYIKLKKKIKNLFKNGGKKIYKKLYGRKVTKYFGKNCAS